MNVAPTAAAGIMGEQPPVCVLIPVWKDPEGLARTLATLADDPLPFDVVVIDDGSPEPVACPGFAGPHRVTLLRLPANRGIEHALNAGLEVILARGYRYVARLDCGDIPLAGRLARQVAHLDAHPEIGVLGTWARCVDDAGGYLFTLRLPPDHAGIMRRQRYVPALLHPTVMIRADALRAAGLYSDRYKAAEDYDLFFRVARHYQLANIPEPLTEYIISPNGTTSRKRRRTLTSRLRLQRAHFTWSDPHAWLGVGQTLLFLGLPYGWIISVKRRLWR
ncbi:MAG: glycosyl transferase [Rhodovulum sulfidophilum]|uniref:Glycosyl transferase n=1 Tax=Rhodovulum sulfidophilum TaxID=35806 RepID=A0A2W5QH04_RHOSU|nr:MAG: glycosyl transferase [Rhodovulum sulfidophilum]